LLLAGLTLPCLAIASICRRLTQYAVVVLLAGAGIALITQGDVPGADWMQESETRRRVALVVITGVSIAMLALSYGARRILSGRIIGATGALAATGFPCFPSHDRQPIVCVVDFQRSHCASRRTE
jgi:hypothetical protein